jgi:hypothetical protein
MEYHSKLNYRFVVTRRIPSLLKHPSMSGEWVNILFNMCLFKISLPNENYYICIDTRDQNNTRTGMGYHLPLLKEVKYYFKVNYNTDEVENDPILKKYSEKIMPIPLFFPIKMPSLIDFRPRLLPCRFINWKTTNIKGRIRALYDLLSLEEMVQYRNTKKDLDLFFVTTYYNQKHHAPAMEFRYQIMKEIKNNKDINSVIGFTNYKDLPKEYSAFKFNQSDTRHYLNNVSRAKVAIYVRGLHNCLSFKLGQLLCMGMPIIGQSIVNNKSILYSNLYFKEQFAYDDPCLIVQKAIELLNQPEKMSILGKANAETIDSKYTPNKIIADILMQMSINIDTTSV